MKMVGNMARLHRLSVSEAKAKLSDALRAAAEAPVVIHSRGRDVAALVSIEEYVELQRGAGNGNGKQFLDAVAELKRRHGGGAPLDVEPSHIRPLNPFGESRDSRRG